MGIRPNRILHRVNVRALVDKLDIPDPWDVDRLYESVAESRGRRIAVFAQNEMGDAMTGAVFRLAASDVVFYRASLSGWHREHVLCHELGHIIAGHLEDEGGYAGGADENLTRTAAMMLARQCAYGEGRERDAEQVAELILSRVRQRVAGTSEDVARAARHLGSALR